MDYIINGEMDGQKIWREKTSREVLLDALDQEKGREMTAEEAQDLFYKTNGSLSDDADKELARIERWCEENNIIITD